MLYFGRIDRGFHEADYGGPYSVDFSADGQLMAAAGKDGVRLFDAQSGQEVAHLPIGHSESAYFLPRDRSIITYGQSGLQRWPLPRDHTSQSQPRPSGPPKLLRARSSSERYRTALSRDGGTIAYLNYDMQQAVVLDANTFTEKVALKGLPRVFDVGLSADGRWAAVAFYRVPEASVRVWDLTTRTQVWQLPPVDPELGTCRVGFSPDGQWLVTGEQDQYRLWRVGSWAPGPEIRRDQAVPAAGPLAFSSDSRMLAIAQSFTTVQLIEPATGREIATLSAPDPQQIISLCFSPDGGQLAVAVGNRSIQLWDLQLIRRQLKDLNLDWDLSDGN
jgi:WD40 repeat protein